MRTSVLLFAARTASGLSPLGAPLRAPAAVATRPALVRTPRAVVMEVEEEVMDEEEFMSEEEYEASMAAGAAAAPAVSEEEYEMEKKVEMSMAAKKVINNMRSDKGVEFAPWMQIDPEASETGAAFGLKHKVLSEEEVELRWETNDETGNIGFGIQRWAGGTSNFVQIASYENFPQLKTKGRTGGIYTFID